MNIEMINIAHASVSLNGHNLLKQKIFLVVGPPPFWSDICVSACMIIYIICYFHMLFFAALAPDKKIISILH